VLQGSNESQHEAGQTEDTIFSSDEDFCEEDLTFHFLRDGERADQDFVHLNPDDDDPDDPGDPDNAGDQAEDSVDDEPDSEEEEEAYHFSIDDEALNTLVQAGRQCTRREILLLNLAVASKNNATYEMLLDIFGTWNVGLGRPGLMPTSKKVLRRLLKRSDAGTCKYAYCPNPTCQSYLGKLKSLREPVHCRCGRITPPSQLKFFVSFSLRKQLEQFLKIHGIFNHLNYRRTRVKFNEDAIEDIFDGELYQSLIQRGLISDNLHNYTFVFNGDGFSLYKDHSLNIWFLLIRLNELPPHLRQRHLFIGGLWIDKGKTNMNAFLKPFVRQVNKLSTQGIQWRPDGGLEINSKFFALACCVDAQARCIMLNMIQYNGYYGCFCCTHQGIQLGGSKYPLLPFPNLPAAQDRTDESMRAAMLRNEFYEGHYGPTQLMLLEHYDLARGNGIDDLHAYYEGVASFLFELLVPLFWNEEEAFRTIDLRMKLIRTPIQISRKWKSIKKRNTFKGSQWGTFIRYFVVVCLLDNNLDEPCVELVSLLSYSLFVLSRDSIAPEERNRAAQYILIFLQRFQESFGPVNMRANIHFLIHAVASVISLGPTWTISCFNFESWNRQIGDEVTSPKGVFDQIIDRHFLKSLLHESIYRNDISEHVRDKLHDILFVSPRKVSEETEEGVVVLGTGKQRQPTPEERNLLNALEVECDLLWAFDRVLVRGVENRTRHYHDHTLSDNSNALTWNETFVTINSIVLVDELPSCLLLVDVHQVDFPLRYAHHIGHFTGGHQREYIDAKTLRVPAIVMPVDNETFIVPISNCREID